MDFSLGFCSVELTGENEAITPELLKAVGNVVGADRNLNAEDLYVRSMFVTSDKINSQGGRFDRTGLEKLCELIPGAPVMIGHDKSKLPIGRCFKAEIVDRNGEPWVKAMFYWLKSTTGSDDLRKNIDGGIYTECSLGFSFGVPQCSICSGDVRKCSHVPGHEYRNISTGSMEKCHYLYRDVNSVNEISLVYRGAVPGTSITSQMQREYSQFASTDSVLVMKAEEILPVMSEFSVEPVYHGIPFVFHRNNGRVLSSAPDGWSGFDPAESMAGSLRELFFDADSLKGVLTCYRGKSRIPVYLYEQARDLSRFGTVRWRLKINIDPESFEQLTDSQIDKLRNHGIDLIVCKYSRDDHQLRRALISAPREGLIVVSGKKAIALRSGSVFRLKVNAVNRTRSGKACYDLSFADQSLGVFRSYETSIKADVGDTLFIEAETDMSFGTFSLRKIKVIDNLKTFFVPDFGLMLRQGRDQSFGKYQLFDLGRGAQLLNLEWADMCSWIVFPNYSEKHLMDGKTLVGYKIDDPEIISSNLCDSGNARLIESSESGMRVEFNGRNSSGEYVLRRAVVQGDKVELFCRLS